MFAIIETNGATHIAIHVPHEGSDKTLPALAAMLEQNATFIRAGYQELTTVKPRMAITLGDSYRCESYDMELAVAESAAVIGPDWVPGTAEVFASNAKVMKKAQEADSKARTEISFLKQEIERLKAMVAAAAEVQAE